MRVRDIRNIGQNPHDYIRELLAHRNRLKIANNTELIVNDDGSVSVWLHKTEIIRAYADGRTILRNGGYATVTTKQRLNAFLPTRSYIKQTDFQWDVWQWTPGNSPSHRFICPFADGMSVMFNHGMVQGMWPSDWEMKKVHALASRFVFGTTDEPTDETIARFIADDANAWDLPIWTYYGNVVLSLARDMREAIGTPLVA